MKEENFFESFPEYNNLSALKDFPPKVEWHDEITSDKVVVQKKSPIDNHWFVNIKPGDKEATSVSYELALDNGKWEMKNLQGLESGKIEEVIEYTNGFSQMSSGHYSNKFHPVYEKETLKAAKEKVDEEEKKEKQARIYDKKPSM